LAVSAIRFEVTSASEISGLGVEAQEFKIEAMNNKNIFFIISSLSVISY
jgi:hypothetical protein